MVQPILEVRADTGQDFCWFLRVFEDFMTSFWDFLTFRVILWLDKFWIILKPLDLIIIRPNYLPGDANLKRFLPCRSNFLKVHTWIIFVTINSRKFCTTFLSNGIQNILNDYHKHKCFFNKCLICSSKTLSSFLDNFGSNGIQNILSDYHKNKCNI